ncbi:MAG: PorV/PorQ family protein [Candidatus Marinimicrobia bacterium]|nr:PorV/PorQ family protein [Candidatus Neomarinimicrobiota bacterium]MCH7762818.1 PorV/PorQ family protein [Candidatus Neomarinimicrobiota bacterium]
MMIKYQARLGLLLTVFILLGAQIEAGSKNRSGTAGAQQLLIPVGSGGTAMAGANVASISGIEAVEWNIAGLAKISGTGEAMFSHATWLDGIGVSYFGVASSFGGKSVFGITFKSLDLGDIPVTTMEATSGTGEMYSPSLVNIAFLYARKMTDRISFGFDFKIVSETIMRVNATGAVIDAGVQYATSETGIHIGASLRNLGLNMIFTGSDLEEFVDPFGSEPGTPTEPRRITLQDFEMPTTLELGVSYGPMNFGPAKILLSGSFLNNNFYFDEYRFGVQANVLDILYLRSGLAIGYDPEPWGKDGVQDTDDDSEDEQFEWGTEEFMWGPSFGFGINLSKLTGLGLSVDYAYRTAEYFDGVSWLTIKAAF